MNHLASVEQGTSLVLDADVVKGPESHAEYMSEGNIKSYVLYYLSSSSSTFPYQESTNR